MIENERAAALTEREALAELVACKAIRERIAALANDTTVAGFDEYRALSADYDRRQPLAWAAARTALAATPESGSLTERERFEARFRVPGSVWWNGSEYEVRAGWDNSYTAERQGGRWEAWQARAALTPLAPLEPPETVAYEHDCGSHKTLTYGPGTPDNAREGRVYETRELVYKTHPTDEAAKVAPLEPPPAANQPPVPYQASRLIDWSHLHPAGLSPAPSSAGLASDAQDALRYRWVRSEAAWANVGDAEVRWVFFVPMGLPDMEEPMRDLDAGIDAAMKGKS